jgi:hypothetical protein
MHQSPFRLRVTGCGGVDALSKTVELALFYDAMAAACREATCPREQVASVGQITELTLTGRWAMAVSAVLLAGLLLAGHFHSKTSALAAAG